MNNQNLFNDLVNQDSKFKTCSDKYMVISTKDIFEMIKEKGFTSKVVRATNTHDKDKMGFQKHTFEIVPENNKLNNKDEMQMRIHGINSYDGSSSLRFEGGLMRQICDNGLKMSFNIFNPVRLVHRQINKDNLLCSLEKCISQFTDVNDIIKELQTIELSEDEKNEYANRIFELRTNTINSDNVIKDEYLKLLIPNRVEDDTNLAWNILNTVQENIFSWQNAKELMVKSKNRKKEETTKKIRRLASNGDTSNRVNQGIFSEMLDMTNLFSSMR